MSSERKMIKTFTSSLNIWVSVGSSCVVIELHTNQTWGRGYSGSLQCNLALKLQGVCECEYRQASAFLGWQAVLLLSPHIGLPPLCSLIHECTRASQHRPPLFLSGISFSGHCFVEIIVYAIIKEHVFSVSVPKSRLRMILSLRMI